MGTRRRISVAKLCCDVDPALCAYWDILTEVLTVYCFSNFRMKSHVNGYVEINQLLLLLIIIIVKNMLFDVIT